ncbi:hypothetical protein ACJJTC_006429 [Scirpophaga incertulas]
MPLTSAERVKRYREKLKKDPEKFAEHKKKHAALVKSKTKKVADLSEIEKQKLREKWRIQKRRQKENKKSSCAPAPLISQPLAPVEKKKRKKIGKLAKKYKDALKKINMLTVCLQTTRKNLYRLKMKYKKSQELIEKIKAREEILEYSMKQSLKQTKTRKEKWIIKRIVNNERIVRARKKVYVAKLLVFENKLAPS